jgi:hypothetical protein
MVSKTLWLPVIGYEGLYEVSNRGEVRSLPKEVRDSKGRRYSREGKVLKQTTTALGYKKVNLSHKGVSKSFRVHRLVAQAFVPKLKEEENEVNHLDGDKANNTSDNLEWCTSSGNKQHALKEGLLQPPSGDRHWNCKLKERDHKVIHLWKSLGFPQVMIAEAFGVSPSSISEVLNYKRKSLLRNVQ